MAQSIDQLIKFESPAQALERDLRLEGPIVLKCYHSNDDERPRRFAEELRMQCPADAVGCIASEPVYSGNMGVFNDFYAVVWCMPENPSE